MAEVVVFVGPTLTAETVSEALPGAQVVGPAMCTDVYLHAERRPLAIGIVDGVFESVPAIWHKEILWALEQGVHVLGASSMGAIRAAELDAFGMRGIGVAYRLLASGELDDDDVAVAHAGAEEGYRALSEPLVNIHVTLVDAVAAGVLTRAEASDLRGLAKARYYPERSYQQMLTDARVGGHDEQSLRDFDAWLETGHRDAKREDALLLLEALAELREDPTPFRPTFRLNRTIFFLSLQEAAGRRAALARGHHADLVEELHLLPGEFVTLRKRAEARALAVELARIDLEPIDQSSVDEASDLARLRLGLLRPDELHVWLEETGLTFEQYGRIVRDEVRRARIADGHELDVDAAIIDELALTDRLRALRQRSREKAEVLARLGANDGAPRADLPRDDELIDWFFSSRDISRSDDLDVDAWGCGFRDGYDLLRALRREWCYVQEASGRRLQATHSGVDVGELAIDRVG